MATSKVQSARLTAGVAQVKSARAQPGAATVRGGRHLLQVLQLNQTIAVPIESIYLLAQ